jgi:hypothetical protein
MSVFERVFERDGNIAIDEEHGVDAEFRPEGRGKPDAIRLAPASFAAARASDSCSLARRDRQKKRRPRLLKSGPHSFGLQLILICCVPTSLLFGEQSVDQALTVRAAPSGHEIIAFHSRVAARFAAGDVVKVGIVARTDAKRI